MEDSEVKPGDIVRLLQSFRPQRYCFREYAFAIVAGVVRDEKSKSQNQRSSDSEQIAPGHQSGWNGLVVYLYEPDSSTIYVDEFGDKALFSFDSAEVLLHKTFPTPASKQNQWERFAYLLCFRNTTCTSVN